MKKLLTLAACGLLLTGCIGPAKFCQPLIPPGASYVAEGVSITVSMTGAGNMTIQRLVRIGTNSTLGWPKAPTVTTNPPPVVLE